MIRAAILLMVLLCSACQEKWPDPGQGGMAEMRWPERTPVYPPPGLHETLVCTLGRLAALRDASARLGQNNGEVGLLDLRAIRAKREYAGLLYRDDAVTLAELDTAIDEVRRSMTVPPPIPGDCAHYATHPATAAHASHDVDGDAAGAGAG